MVEALAPDCEAVVEPPEPDCAGVVDPLAADGWAGVEAAALGLGSVGAFPLGLLSMLGAKASLPGERFLPSLYFSKGGGPPATAPPCGEEVV